MIRGDEVFLRLQAKARSDASRSGRAAPTQEYLIRHALESFLEPLGRTVHGEGFVLKGGTLLGAYGVRRPTKDVDVNAVNATVTPDHLAQVVRDVATVSSEDGVDFDVDSFQVCEIREGSTYPGFRVRLGVTVGSWRGNVVWDVSTGDPIEPPPQVVAIQRLLGDSFTVLGYAIEGIIAEKVVTVFERGVTSTRWRDYVDIVGLCRQGFDATVLRVAIATVAQFRRVPLGRVSERLEGYGFVGQAKWAAWRRKMKLEAVCEASLDDQIKVVASFIDPVLEGGRNTSRPREPL